MGPSCRGAQAFTITMCFFPSISSFLALAQHEARALDFEKSIHSHNASCVSANSHLFILVSLSAICHGSYKSDGLEFYPLWTCPTEPKCWKCPPWKSLDSSCDCSFGCDCKNVRSHFQAEGTWMGYLDYDRGWGKEGFHPRSRSLRAITVPYSSDGSVVYLYAPKPTLLIPANALQCYSGSSLWLRTPCPLPPGGPVLSRCEIAPNFPSNGHNEHVSWPDLNCPTAGPCYQLQKELVLGPIYPRRITCRHKRCCYCRRLHDMQSIIIITTFGLGCAWNLFHSGNADYAQLYSRR